MITRFQSAPLPVSPRPLRSRSGSVIQFGHSGGHVHTEKCNQGQCDQVKPKEGKAPERQFFLIPIFEKVRAFFVGIWNWITKTFPGLKKQTAPPDEEKATPKTEPTQEPLKPMDDIQYCQPSGEGSPPPPLLTRSPSRKPKHRCGSGCVH